MHIEAFARGHLDVAGRADHRQVEWSRTDNSVRAFRDVVAGSTGVSPTSDERMGTKGSILYRGPSRIAAIRRRLSANESDG